MGAPSEDNIRNHSTSPIPLPDPKERLRGTLRPPSLWIAARHHQGVVVEDLEASQPMNSMLAKAVEHHYRQGCWAPLGTGNRWSGLRALTSMEQQNEQRGHQQEIGMESRVRENREIADEERTRKRDCRVIE